jgi:hypothetical protein
MIENLEDIEVDLVDGGYVGEKPGPEINFWDRLFPPHVRPPLNFD